MRTCSSLSLPCIWFCRLEVLLNIVSLSYFCCHFFHLRYSRLVWSLCVLIRQLFLFPSHLCSYITITLFPTAMAQDDLNNLMSRILCHLSAATWYECMPQLASRTGLYLSSLVCRNIICHQHSPKNNTESCYKVWRLTVSWKGEWA